MIEKMKRLTIVQTASRKEEMLTALEALGVLHIKEKKSADKESLERFATLSRVSMTLQDYEPEKMEEKELLSDDAFETLYKNTLAALEKKDELTQKESADRSEIERILEWGDFDPKDIEKLKKSGYDLHFYRLGKKELENILKDEGIKAIKLKEIDKMEAIAVLGTLPNEIQATEFILPEKSLSDLKYEIEKYDEEIASCNEILRDASQYKKNFSKALLKAQNEEIFSSANETAETVEDTLVLLSGYIPEADLEKFKEVAKENSFAYIIDDVTEDDEAIPTKMKYNKVTKLIAPIFDFLGILPGYYEQDVSLWFLMFFTLFVAMIIGDGGYGLIIVIFGIFLLIKQKKLTNITLLALVLGIGTVVWGAVTGTWFGAEKAMEIPFLKALVIPSFANYPEYFNVTTTAQQNTIMKFSFSIGAIQMTLGSILAVKSKLPKKDLSLIADIGWAIAVVSMYLLSLYIVIGEDIPTMPIVIGVAIAFILVVLFGGMSPDKTFAQGLKAGLADTFTVFLNTISCFGNVMSYIRLFAVGMASLAIAQSFNGIAAGFSGPLVILGVLVLLIGHALNFVMALLSVVVHGVRLNVLEFSGQVGLGWTGIPYEPFKENEKLKK